MAPEVRRYRVAWGYNGKKQSNVPADLTNVSAVAAGEGYSMALKADGTDVAWGADASMLLPG